MKEPFCLYYLLGLYKLNLGVWALKHTFITAFRVLIIFYLALKLIDLQLDTKNNR